MKLQPTPEALDAIWEAIHKELVNTGVALVNIDQDGAYLVANAAWEASKKHLEGVIAPLEARVTALEEEMGHG